MGLFSSDERDALDDVLTPAKKLPELSREEPAQITPKKKSEFLVQLSFAASSFGWDSSDRDDQAVAELKRREIFAGSEKGSENPIVQAVTAFSAAKTSTTTRLDIMDLAVLEEAWEYYQEHTEVPAV